MAESVKTVRGVTGVIGVIGVIDEVLAGEVDAYAQIVREHQDEVWRIAAFALRDVAATEDVVQQVFVDAYLALGGYDTTRDFGAWLRSIARNRVRKEIRRRMRETGKLRAYREHVARRMNHDEDAEAREPGLDDMREALSRCREELSPDATRALECRYERAMTFGEIAELLGRTVQATRQLLQRVRLSLRRCIEGRTARS